MFIPLNLAGLNLTIVKWSAIALAAIGLLLTIYSHGRHVAEGEVAEAQRDIAIAYAGEVVKAQAAADTLAADNEKLRATKAPKDRLITQEVTRYEFIEAPGHRCTLPGTWRLLHDAAATGTPPAAEAGTLAAGSPDPVTDAAALRTLSDNYSACRDSIEKVKAWQRRYQTIEAAHEKTD